MKEYFQSRTAICKNDFSTVYNWHETCLPKALLWRSLLLEGNVAFGETPAGNVFTLKISWRLCWKNDFSFCNAGWSFWRSRESVVTNFAATAFNVVGFVAIGILISLDTCLARSCICWWIKFKTGDRGKRTVILGIGTGLSTLGIGRTIGDVPIGMDVNGDVQDQWSCWAIGDAVEIGPTVTVMLLVEDN